MTSVPDIDLHTDYGSTPPGQMGGKLASDHANIESWANTKLLPTLAKVIRDDDTLKSGIVRTRNLHPEVIAAMGTGAGSSDPSVLLVETYGAVGDGVTDDTQAVIDCIEAAPVGSTVKFNGEKHYYLRSLGTITKALTIDGGGCRITCDLTPTDTTGAPLFSFAGSAGTALACNAATEGAKSITTTTPADAGNLAANDYALIESADVVNKWDGSGAVAVVKREVAQVSSVNSGTGVVALVAPLSHSMTAVTVKKLTMVAGPVVRNFSRISEVYAGAPYAGSIYEGSGAPNIVDFWMCERPVAERINVIGWNLEAFQFTYCYGPVASELHAQDSYNPATGGTGIMVRVGWCRHMSVRNCIGRNLRHMIDWYGSLDGKSEFNHCEADATSTSVNAAFITHGYISKRILSVGDSVTNGQGWYAGNATYAADYDITIRDFSYYGADGSASINPLVVTGGTSRVSIESPRINTASGGVRIATSCDKVSIRGGYINSSRAAGGSPIYAYDGGTSFWPSDITIEGVELIGPSDGYGVNCDAEGTVVIRGNRITAGVGVVCCDDAAPSSLCVDGNDITVPGGTIAAIRVSPNGVNTPTDIYSVCNNRMLGATTQPPMILNGTTFMRVVGNRAPDAANALWLLLVTNLQVADGKGEIHDNGACSSDIICSKGEHWLNGTISDTVILKWMVGGSVRHGIMQYGAGSDLRQYSYNDDGSYRDTVWEFDRTAGGLWVWSRPLKFAASTTALASTNFPIGTAPTAPALGDVWNDIARKALRANLGTLTQTLSGCAFTMTSAVTIADSVVETSLIGAGVGTMTIPSNFWAAGKTLRLTVSGKASTSGTPNWNWETKLGGTTILDPTVSAVAAAMTAHEWTAVITITCIQTGQFGELRATLHLIYCVGRYPNSVAITNNPTGFDTRSDLLLDFTFVWGTASPSNTITSMVSTLEVLN